MQLPNQAPFVHRTNSGMLPRSSTILPSVLVTNTGTGRVTNAVKRQINDDNYYGPRLCGVGDDICFGTGALSNVYRCCGPGYICAQDAAGGPACRRDPALREAVINYTGMPADIANLIVGMSNPN